MEIRMATESDLQEILEIYRPYVETTAITFEYVLPGEAEFLARFRKITACGPWLVCTEQGKILGYAYLDRAFSRAAYSWAGDLSVYLRMDARGRGIGRAFYALLERMAAAQGYQLLYGIVTSENSASCRFHEAQGYVQTACLPSCGFKFGRWLGVLWYEKRLCPPTAPSAMPTPNPQMDWSRLDVSDLTERFQIRLVAR